jgi:hypothetical protein
LLGQKRGTQPARREGCALSVLQPLTLTLSPGGDMGYT